MKAVYQSRSRQREKGYETEKERERERYRDSYRQYKYIPQHMQRDR